MVQSINLGSTQAPYWEYTKTLAANEIWKLDYVTDSFHILEVSADNAVRVSFGGSMIETPFTAGMGYKLNEPVEFIQLQNITNNPVTIKFAVGIGNIRDDRLTLSGTANFNLVSQNGYKTFTASTATGASDLNYGANAQIDVICTSGTIVLNNSDGITNLTLTAGMSLSTRLANAGTLSISAGGNYNYSIGEY